MITIRFFTVIILLILRMTLANAQFAIFQVSSNAIPTADLVCTITTGACTGTGGGSSLFTAATCNGVSDDAAAFMSFNNWAVNTWQMAHVGLIQLNTPPSTCQFIANAGSNNAFTLGIKSFQLVGYGTTLADNGTTGHGYNLGATGIVNDHVHSVTFATIAAGATSVTISDTSKCSLFAANDWTLLGGFSTIEQSGYPPTLAFYEYIQINSVAACAGSGVITFLTATRYGYKSTWPANWTSSTEASFNNGPGQIFALDQRWVTTQAFYGVRFDQGGTTGTHINANGKNISFYDVSTPMGNLFGPIASQNSTWSLTRASFPSVIMEVDKVVETATISNSTIHRLLFQSGNNPQNFTCNSCTIDTVTGTSASATIFSGGTISDISIGTAATGAAGSFSATNTTISALSIAGSNSPNVEKIGVWASGTLTIPRNITISSAADNGSGKIRLTVNSTAGWTTGVGGVGPGGNCSGFLVVQVIDSTHLDIPGTNFTGTCSGLFGSLWGVQPTATWIVPGSYFYFSGGGSPTQGPIFKINDISVGAFGEVILNLYLNGSPYAGGFPVMPGSTWSASSHMAPSWSCTGCTGALAVLDVTGRPTGPYGSNTSRVVTSANNTASGATSMANFGSLIDLSVTVTAACSGASNITLQNPFIMTLGSASSSNWNPIINAATASGTPRVVTPTGSSGAQGGDTLTSPGTGTWLLREQQEPLYSTVANCGAASTTVTIRTDQGVTYP